MIQGGNLIMTSPITAQDIFLAHKQIRSYIWETPLVESPGLSEASGSSVRLKLECMQKTGSFKMRGASNRIFNLSREELARGVVAVSSGNHGRAVAYAARELGANAVICLSERVPKNKVRAIEQLGAEVVVSGDSYDAAEANAHELQRARGLTPMPSFDDEKVIAGQGTVGLELMTQWPQIDTAVVPIGGGSIFSGVGVFLKSVNPAIRMVGVAMDRAPVMYHSLKAGEPLEMPEEPTIADALAGGIGGRENKYTFRLIQDIIDEYALVSEEEIAEAMVFALKEHKIAVEGAGAVGIAALLNRRVEGLGRNVAVVVTGGGVDVELLSDLAQGKRPFA
jgi:threonine dehydratase